MSGHKPDMAAGYPVSKKAEYPSNCPAKYASRSSKTKVDTTNFSGVAEENNTKQKQVENCLDWPIKNTKFLTVLQPWWSILIVSAYLLILQLCLSTALIFIQVHVNMWT